MTWLLCLVLLQSATGAYSSAECVTYARDVPQLEALSASRLFLLSRSCCAEFFTAMPERGRPASVSRRYLRAWRWCLYMTIAATVADHHKCNYHLKHAYKLWLLSQNCNRIYCIGQEIPISPNGAVHLTLFLLLYRKYVFLLDVQPSTGYSCKKQNILIFAVLSDKSSLYASCLL